MQPFHRDSRGNRLEHWAMRDHENGGHSLWIRGTDEMTGQIRHVAPNYQDIVVPALHL